MSNRRKILFVGINQRYINATNALLPAVIMQFSDLHFYGPGFVKQSILEQGIERYVEKLGGIDLIVVTAQCITKSNAERFNRYLNRFTFVFNGGKVNAGFLQDVEAFCKQNRKRVICGISEVDPHVTQRSTLDSLLEHAGFLLGWGNGFLDARRDMEQVEKEEYIQKKLKKGFELGLIDHFAIRHSDKFINLGHYVGDNEFYWGSLSVRKYDVAVPGSGYARRRQVVDTLGNLAGVRLAKAKYQYIFKIGDRLRFRPYSNFYLLHLYNLAFQKLMSQSKSCVTEGGANNYLVRKFFEIPASGALMICWPAIGLESLGFRDGVNCIFVRNEKEVAQTVKEIVRDSSQFERIADAGRALVYHRHSVAARAIQFNVAVEKILAGIFNGSSWHNGHFSCEPVPDTAGIVVGSGK